MGRLVIRGDGGPGGVWEESRSLGQTTLNRGWGSRKGKRKAPATQPRPQRGPVARSALPCPTLSASVGLPIVRCIQAVVFGKGLILR